MEISSPYNVRKEGSEVSPLVPAARWYNPKTAGYLENQRRRDGGEKVLDDGILGEAPRMKLVAGGRPKMDGVTVGDLWPPPVSREGIVESGSGKGKGKVFGGGDRAVIMLGR